LANNPEAQAGLAEMLAQCFDGLRLYGKEPEQITGTVGLFRLVLAPFTMEQISNAFQVYLSRNTEMPTPSCIAQIIRRGGKPPLVQAVYVSLTQKRQRTAWKTGSHSWQQGDGLTDSEADYIREYEADALNGHAEGGLQQSLSLPAPEGGADPE